LQAWGSSVRGGEQTEGWQSMTSKERELITRAMDVLQSATCGGIGADGMTMADLEACWADGHMAEDDAMYDTCQHAWRILEMATKAGKWKWEA
jgi:hypothetical protein